MEREQILWIAKALGDETRLMIFEAISARPDLKCGEIVLQRPVTPATVSHHLRILVRAGLIECHREGQFVRSRSVPKTIDRYLKALIARRPKGSLSSVPGLRRKGKGRW
jgi:ArsR family transcriptional regulator